MVSLIRASKQLRDIWAKECKQTGTGRIDILLGLSKMTLDVIGLAGVDVYAFESRHLA